MKTRFAIVMACVCVALLAGCGRINWARMNSDMTDAEISEHASKRLQVGMTMDEIEDRAVWFRFHRSAKLGMRNLCIEPDWERQESVSGSLAGDWPGPHQQAPSSASLTVECMAWRLEESGFVWEFMVRPSEENLYAVMRDNGQLVALFRTEMSESIVNSRTGVLRRIPLTPEPAP